MIGGKAPLTQLTEGQIRGSLIAGTAIGVTLLVASFFGHNRPAWFDWGGRVIVALWLVHWWRIHLGELRRRKSAP